MGSPYLRGTGLCGQHENIVFVGPTGRGQSGVARGIVLEALQNGYQRLRFICAHDLFDEM